MTTIEWAVGNWFQILVLLVLIAIALALYEIPRSIVAAAELLAARIEQFDEAICQEADEQAWADEGHRFSLADRLIANLQSLEKTIRAERQRDSERANGKT
jgi:hypothetical protein